MGMFDEFVFDKPISCPHCHNHQFESTQSKQFECLLGYFHQGIRAAYSFPIRDYNDISHGIEGEVVGMSISKPIPDGVYFEDDRCINCNKTITFELTIKDGVFTKVRII